MEPAPQRTARAESFSHPGFPFYRDFRNDVTSQRLYTRPFSLTLISFSWTYNQ
nr:MAG TPA: hypothetical protein [Caudoviricetes sp.]